MAPFKEPRAAPTGGAKLFMAASFLVANQGVRCWGKTFERLVDERRSDQCDPKREPHQWNDDENEAVEPGGSDDDVGHAAAPQCGRR